MSQQLRIVLIGIGGMGDIYTRALKDMSSVRLVAGACRTRDRGEAFAKKYDCKWYDEYERMLDTEKPDIALICTPSGAHLEPALACAARKINIICTKPLEITVARCRQMTSAADKAGIVIAGLFPDRFRPGMKSIHQLVSAGRIGSLAVISSQTPWWREDKYYAGRWQGTLALDGGGAIINQSIHGVDAMQWIAAAAMPDLPAGVHPVESVMAMTALRSHGADLMEVEDTAVASLRFRNGALGQLLGATSMYPGSLRTFTVAGRDGTLKIVEDELVEVNLRNPQPGDDQHKARAEKNTTSGSSDPLAISHLHEQRQLELIVDSILQNKKVPIDGYEATKSIQLIEAIYKSARENRLVKLDEI